MNPKGRAPVPGVGIGVCMEAVYRTHHENEIVFLEALEQERVIFQYLYPELNLLPAMALAEETGKSKPRRTPDCRHEWPTGR